MIEHTMTYRHEMIIHQRGGEKKQSRDLDEDVHGYLRPNMAMNLRQKRTIVSIYEPLSCFEKGVARLSSIASSLFWARNLLLIDHGSWTQG